MTILDNCNNGNPRTIIIPPLKTQNGEVPSECERLMPGERLQKLRIATGGLVLPVNLTINLSATDSMNHQNSSYKFKSSNGVVSGNNHLAGGVSGGGSYRQQRSGPHPLQQQPLNLSQVCEPRVCVWRPELFGLHFAIV